MTVTPHHCHRADDVDADRQRGPGQEQAPTERKCKREAVFANGELPRKPPAVHVRHEAKERCPLDRVVAVDHEDEARQSEHELRPPPKEPVLTEIAGVVGHPQRLMRRRTAAIPVGAHHTRSNARCGSGGSSALIASPGRTSPPAVTIPITPARRTRPPCSSRPSDAAMSPS